MLLQPLRLSNPRDLKHPWHSLSLCLPQYQLDRQDSGTKTLSCRRKKKKKKKKKKKRWGKAR
jgi:hypothetical protein